jgi:exodeoxyribonuclease-5
MDWSPQQDKALLGVKAWLANKKGQQVHRIFGFAGTGKTTLAKEIATMVNGDVHYMCFTGKAALVLRQKGCPGASTIHSAIYRAKRDDRTGKHRFSINKDSVVRHVKLVIVDEVSMVDEKIGQDVLSFGTRVLVLGDPFQLPPIKGEGFFTDRQPDILLTEIHRQARDNPIIRLSMQVRDNQLLVPGTYGASKVIQREQVDRDEVLQSDQVLVGMNKTRQGYNRRIRALRGLEGTRPAMGDRLVCLRNNHEKGLLNGSLWQPKLLKPATGDKVEMEVESLDDDTAESVDVETPIEYFLGTEKDLDWRVKRESDEFTFGWALTCHKAQGSQWPNVFIVDESSVFRENSQRWLYTALTRAAERVTVLVG